MSFSIANNKQSFCRSKQLTFFSPNLNSRRSNGRNVTLSHTQKKERKLAIMLMIVVLVFLMCNVLPFTVNLMELLGLSYKPLTEISNLLGECRSEANFGVCAFSRFGILYFLDHT